MYKAWISISQVKENKSGKIIPGWVPGQEVGQRRESYVLVSVRVVSYIWLTVKVEKEMAIVKTGGLSWWQIIRPCILCWVSLSEGNDSHQRTSSWGKTRLDSCFSKIILVARQRIEEGKTRWKVSWIFSVCFFRYSCHHTPPVLCVPVWPIWGPNRFPGPLASGWV